MTVKDDLAYISLKLAQWMLNATREDVIAQSPKLLPLWETYLDNPHVMAWHQANAISKVEADRNGRP